MVVTLFSTRGSLVSFRIDYCLHMFEPLRQLVNSLMATAMFMRLTCALHSVLGVALLCWLDSRHSFFVFLDKILLRVGCTLGTVVNL